MDATRSQIGGAREWAVVVSGSTAGSAGEGRIAVEAPDDRGTDAHPLDAWLRRLTINSCLDMVRRRRSRGVEVELTPLMEPATDDMSTTVVDRDLLDEALRRLEPEGRAIVVMHYFLGMPLPDVAGAMGIPLGTAKSRLHRSIVAMRRTVGVEESAVGSAIAGGQLA